MARLDKRVSKSTIISSNEKSIEIHNILETNETAKCVFEILMTAHEGRSGLFNINSGANRLILRMCAWFDEIDKNSKSHISTADKSGD